MKTVALLCLCALTGAGMGTAAQARPDFSGTWLEITVIDGKEVVEGSRVITQTPTELTASGYDVQGTLGERWRFVFGGAPTPQDNRMPNVEITSIASWNGDILVIVNTGRMNGRGLVVEEAW